MPDGLGFWIIILAVAILQGMGQRKKKPGQPGQRPQGSPGQAQRGPTGPPVPRPQPPEDQEVWEAPSTPTRAPPRAGRPGGGGESSEGMVPQDVWAEILGLARGEARPDAPEPVGMELDSSGQESEPVALEPEAVNVEGEPRRPLVGQPVPRETRPAPRARVFPVSHGADAVLHASKPGGYNSRLSASRSVSADAGRGRVRGAREKIFGSGSRTELRKAIILSEVLGPPVGFREGED